ncbi:MAG: RNA methyltransferase [Anaerolineales bacterium]|nr:RNA methyltransferase [Anaerolineales bacterium]
MNDRHFEIRLCLTCGLRFPREQTQSFGLRCPHCLGETKIVYQKTIQKEEMTRQKINNQSEMVYAVLLDNIRSAWNVGSILRSADGFGFEHVYLCGITPTPENEAVKKTSLRAEESLTWSYHKDAVELVKQLKVEGWQVFALEEYSSAVSIRNRKSVSSGQKTVLILGSEVTGVDADLLSLCDEIFYIPMQGEKRSLNVAIAFSVAAFALRQNSE